MFFDETNIQEFLSITKNLNETQAQELIRKLTHKKATKPTSAKALLDHIRHILAVMEQETAKYGSLATRSGGGGSAVAGEGGKTPVGKDFDVDADLKGQNAGGGGTSVLDMAEKEKESSGGVDGGILDVEDKEEGGKDGYKGSRFDGGDLGYLTEGNVGGKKGEVIFDVTPKNPSNISIRYFGLKGVDVTKLKVGKTYELFLSISVDLNGSNHEFNGNRLIRFIYIGNKKGKHLFTPTQNGAIQYNGQKLFFRSTKSIGVYAKRIKL